MNSVLPHLPLTSLTAPPTPEQFWAVLVWGVIPTVVGIWIVYRHQQERLRRAHRRLRQLEARLAIVPLPLPPVAILVSTPSPIPRNSRPSPLTARVLIPAAAQKGRGYTQPVPGPLS